MTEVVIFGAGGLGCLVLDTLLQAERYRPVAFLDSDPLKRGSTVDGLTVCGGVEQVPSLLRAGVKTAIVAIGDSLARVQIAELLKRLGMRLVSAVHPLASIAPSAQLGNHLIIGPRVTICVHASIADHCVLSAGAIIEHDNRIGIGAFLHPAARLAGGVQVDQFATLGIGACVIPYRKVGRAARVEPGAVVIRDVLPGSTVGGAPALRLATGQSRFVPDEPRSALATTSARNHDARQRSPAGHQSG
jgi:sugar O-acyltransferase (sialic acid O-acetyltransferase NeuD family)